eukprot:m.46864 g.46864  ORF g.46864 m.46864 type:complete len:82 (+) comp47464_c0_seq2:878-1123(+)
MHLFDRLVTLHSLFCLQPLIASPSGCARRTSFRLLGLCSVRQRDSGPSGPERVAPTDTAKKEAILLCFAPAVRSILPPAAS